MTYLLPLNRNNLEARSEMFSHISDQAFSDTSIYDVKKWTLSKKDYKPERVNTISNIAITIIACAAIVCLPKIAAFGSVAVVAFVYHKFAKMVGNKEKDLLLTMRNQKIIKFLSSPDLKKKIVRDLSCFKNKGTLIRMQLDLESLQEVPLKVILLEKFAKILIEREEINQKLKSLEDLPSLIERVDKNNNTLREMQESLESLEEDSFLKRYLVDGNAMLLMSQKNLYQKLKNLQENELFFKENGTLLLKIATFVLNTDLNILNKVRDCRDFIFYSLTSTPLIKAAIFFSKEIKPKVNWSDIDRGDVLDLIGFLTIAGLAESFIIGAVINALEALDWIERSNIEILYQINHRNTEIPTITEFDKKELNLLLEQA